MATKQITLFLIVALLSVKPMSNLRAQTFTSYFTGDTTDVTSAVKGGIVLMGGATESNEAMRWFLEQSGGGDIVVIRASGTNGYNNYLFSSLGVTVNSVETIVTSSLSAANMPYVAQQIRRAEGLWIAGGDQANYVNFWKDGPVEDAIRYLIHTKKAPVGGTSAGMAIQGQAYFAALNGSVTTSQALNNPYNSKVTLGNADFLDHEDLKSVITDSHYDNPDRRGRQVAFMARLATDFGIDAKGIASEEYTAVCIDSSGWARVYGSYPQDQDFAYFLQINCEIQDAFPQVCMAGTPLEWSQNQATVKVYKVPGTTAGSNRFYLRDWKSSTGTQGVWENWWVENGALKTASGAAPLCLSATHSAPAGAGIRISPNPSNGIIQIQVDDYQSPIHVEIINMQGLIQTSFTINQSNSTQYLELKSTGLYLLRTRTQSGTGIYPIIFVQP